MFCYHPPMASKTMDEQFSEAETAQRRDAVLKRMLNTPPRPRGQKPVKTQRPKKRQKVQRTPR